MSDSKEILPFDKDKATKFLKSCLSQSNLEIFEDNLLDK